MMTDGLEITERQFVTFMTLKDSTTFARKVVGFFRAGNGLEKIGASVAARFNLPRPAAINLVDYVLIQAGVSE